MSMVKRFEVEELISFGTTPCWLLKAMYHKAFCTNVLLPLAAGFTEALGLTFHSFEGRTCREKMQ